VELSDSAYTVLGMLRLGAQSGYEIQRAAEASTRFFWAISPNQVYSNLAALEAEGLIVSEPSPRGERKRTFYELTAEGEQELRNWVLQPGELSFELRDLGVLKLFFADAVSNDEALGLVRRIRDRSERALEQFEWKILPLALKIQGRGDAAPLLAARYGRGLQEGILAVCDELERELKQQTATARRPRQSRIARR
jgi:PadR family transcriptional regulator, regulatory protein AphA